MRRDFIHESLRGTRRIVTFEHIQLENMLVYP